MENGKTNGLGLGAITTCPDCGRKNYNEFDADFLICKCGVVYGLEDLKKEENHEPN